MPPFTYKTDGEILYHTEINDIFTTLESLGLDVDGLKAGVASLTTGKADAVHTHSTSDLTATGGTNTSFLRKDNTWATPTNTTYSLITQAEAEAGTSTTGRLISGQRLLQAINALAPVKAIDLTNGLATKADLVHNHNDEYYTKFDIDSFSLGSDRQLPATSTNISINREAIGTVKYPRLEAGGSGGDWGTEDKAARSDHKHDALYAAKSEVTGLKSFSIQAVFDGAGDAITSGMTADVIMPFSGSFNAWRMVANTTGSASFTIHRATYAAYPTFTNVVGIGTVLMSNTAKNAGNIGSTITFSEGDVIRFSVSSASTVSRVVVSLTATRS